MADEATPAVEQRQHAQGGDLPPVVPMAWSLRSDDEVRALAQGCTELTCLYHGRFVEELRRRSLAKGAERG